MSLLKNAFYAAPIERFLATSDADIRAELDVAQQASFASTLSLAQDAWDKEISLLKACLNDYKCQGRILFEYTIPRMGRRVDVVLLIKGIVILLEFKVEQSSFDTAAISQVWDYALDIKNFHAQSIDLDVVPVLICTSRKSKNSNVRFNRFKDGVYEPLKCNGNELKLVLQGILEQATPHEDLDTVRWEKSGYAPTPTIIEAARALYENHSVQDIARSDATAENLSVTCSTIQKIISETRSRPTDNAKSICFVTGVPGAGKTLVGLETAFKNAGGPTNIEERKVSNAVYLSGNYPLVTVLTEALARDAVERNKKVRKLLAKGQSEQESKDKFLDESEAPLRKEDAKAKVKLHIQMVHHYRDTCLKGVKIENDKVVEDPAYFSDPKHRKEAYIPFEHIAIFDEAQRAWSKEMLANFMNQKRKVKNFPYSEPQFLISCLDRHEDWAVIVCLVGEGQEINRGEEGISGWLDALKGDDLSHWDVYLPHELARTETDSITGFKSLDRLHFEEGLHLKVSLRSFRGENLADFVQQLLARDVEKAKMALTKLEGNSESDPGRRLEGYPIYLTRSLDEAKRWLKSMARGTERIGILAASTAERLKPLSVNVRFKPDEVHWFLDDDSDVRSSNFLEDVATEFQVQGLEVDWSCVVWDADFRYTPEGWQHFAFNSSKKWNNIRKESAQEYQTNAYRVLLTRARQGMVICVPKGNAGDVTRRPEYYDKTYAYLVSLGLKPLSEKLKENRKC